MKLLLFDLDGTLVSTGGAGLRALDRAFEALYGLKDAMSGVRPAGKVDPMIVREIFTLRMDRPAESKDIRDVCEIYLKFLADEIVRSVGYHVLDGVRELLEALSKRNDVLLALGTGNWEPGARIKLERGRLNRYFTFGGFGSDAELRADVLRAGVKRAEERLGKKISPWDVFVIGDTVLDVQAGRAIGAITVAVDGEGHQADLKAANPDIFLNTCAQSRALMEALDSASPSERLE